MLLRLIPFGIALFSVIGSVRAQWVQTNGPRGGDITALAVNGQSIFAASDGIYRSHDHGASWILVDTVTNITNLTSGDGAVFVLSNASLLRSVDDGVTWDSHGLNNVQALSVNGKNLLAGFSDSIRYSNDNGSTWRNFPHPHGKRNPINFVSILDNTLLVSFLDQNDPNPPYEVTSHGGVYSTSDFGITWDSIYPKPFYSIAHIGKRIFAASPDGLLDTIGSNWKKVTSLPNQVSIRSIATIGSDLYTVAYGIGLYRSTDSGRNWELTDADLKGRDVHNIAVDGQAILVSTDDGLYRSTDQGLTWNELSISGASTYNLLSVPDGLIAVDGDILLYPGSVPIFFSSNDGDTWQKTASGFALGANQVLTLGSMFFATTGSGLAYSTDHGATWTIRTDTFKYGNFINSNGTLYEASYHEVFRSDDSGSTWKQIGARLDTVVQNCEIGGFAVMGTTLFVGDECGWGIWRSEDGGLTWNKTMHSAGGILSMFAFGESLFANTPYGVYRSTDKGDTWSHVLENNQSNCCPEAIATHDIFVSKYDGLFLSTDTGATWANVGQGLWNHGAQSLSVRGNYLFAGTGGGGVWRRLLSDMEPAVSNTIPSLIAYPNPISSTTTIRYSLPSISETNIAIYDALGRIVTTLFSAEQAPGAYEVNFQPNGLQPGVYWCSLSTQNGIRAVPLLIEPK